MNWYIYKITNLINGKAYVGQRHNNNPLTDTYMGSGTALRRAYRKYGMENFKKEILFDGLTSVTAANIFESYFINKEETFDHKGYNLRSSCIQGGKLSHESIEKIRKSLTGRAASDETKKKLSESLKGHQVSDETRRKISAFHKGKKVSDEAKKKMSIAAKQKPYPSEETRKKLSDASKGRKMSEEAKKKIGEKLKGRQFSEETKRKISETLKGNTNAKKY